MGTFSRTVFSALRISYLVVPKSLIPGVYRGEVDVGPACCNA